MFPSPRDLFPIFHCPLCPPDAQQSSTHNTIAFFPAPPNTQSHPPDITHPSYISSTPANTHDCPFPDPFGNSDGDSDADDPPSRHTTPQRHNADPTSPPDPHDFEKTLSTELTCEICFMLLYQPVTTPCQHTFCSKCLQRSLDHSMLCPLCRQEFPGFAYFQEHPHNKVILSLLLEAFPDAYSARGDAMEREVRDARLDTSIFICQLSFPGMPTLLHFFEPRYRLMLRRSPIPGHGPNAGSEFGTMLEIRSVQMLADGRSMVETRGTHRFRLLEQDSLDGYLIGRVEKIDDYDDDLAEWAAQDDDRAPSSSNTTHVDMRPSPQISLTRITPRVSPPSSPASTTGTPQHLLSIPTLLEICHTFLDQLRAGTAPWVVQRLNYTYGPQPPDTDPGAFSFWMGMVLPIDEHEKAKLLPVKSARLRLRMVVGWIEQLNSNWWFTSGCTVV
ncbi:PUA-like domain-containing protein [Boletus edulis]|nr:PUA-like domain-containing protein [Boletus edulis]